MLAGVAAQGRRRRPGDRRRVPEAAVARRRPRIASTRRACSRRRSTRSTTPPRSLAALFMVGTLAMVLLGIVGRLLGFNVPGTDAYAGYCMAARGFLALAHTLKRGEHIRVTLLLEHAARRRAARRSRSGALAVAHAAGRAVRLLQRAARLAVVRRSTTSRPATTPRRCGFRSSRWRSARVVLLIAFVDELVLELARPARAGRQRRAKRCTE